MLVINNEQYTKIYNKQIKLTDGRRYPCPLPNSQSKSHILEIRTNKWMEYIFSYTFTSKKLKCM